MLKKCVTVLMAALVLMGVLSSCGLYQPEQSKKKENEISAETTENVMNTADMKISIYRCIYDEKAASVEETIRTENELNRFLYENEASVEVELHDFTPDVYTEAVKTALLSEKVDLFWVGDDMTDIDYFTLSNSLSNDSEKEKLSFMRTGEIGKDGLKLIAKEDNRTDVSSVKNPEDLHKTLAALKKKKTEVPLLMYGSLFNEMYLDRYEPVLPGSTLFSIKVGEEDVISPFETEEYRDYCHSVSAFREEGLISEKEATGEVPFTLRDSDRYGLYAEHDIVAEIMPKQDKVTVTDVVQPRVTCTSYYGNGYIIPSYVPENRRRYCIEWIKLLTREEELRSLYGYADAEVKNQDEADAQKMSPAAGFVFDYRELKSTYVQVMRVVNEYGNALETGCYPEDMVDEIITEYCGKLEEAGYKKLLNAASEQYKVWLKK